MPKLKSFLFINKQRSNSDISGDWGYAHESGGKSSGLANSVTMVAKMLTDKGVKVWVEEAIDNNCIDRLVTLYSPDVVVIEALWVVPEKFEVLHKLHPNVQWIVRIHSEIPFIANEGMAMGWLQGYAAQREYLTVAANSSRIRKTLINLLGQDVAYLPNYYTCERRFTTKNTIEDVVNISCFGAIRPLKNHLSQAVAAIHYADAHNLSLAFHINGTRVEGHGGAILKNLRELFPAYGRHTLVEHGWYQHDEFKQVLRDQIDIGMQVSFTESYNIVAADHIDCGIPVVTSSEVAFVAWPYVADPTDIDGMVAALDRSTSIRRLALHRVNNVKLDAFNRQAALAWTTFARGH
jgi:hypothetical protein